MLIIKFLNIPLGVDSTPLGLRKCIDLDALSSVAAFGSNLFNYFSSKDANEKNLQMTREANEMNYKIASEANQLSQAQFDKNMKWLREQYYDTDQLVRLKAAAAKAGFNPALALGSVQPIGSVGQASPSQFHAAHMEAGHVDPYLMDDSLSESVGHAVDAYYQNQLLNEQADNVHVDSQLKRGELRFQIAEKLAHLREIYTNIELKLSQKDLNNSEREKLNSEKEQIDWSIRLFKDQYDDLKEQPKKSNKLLDAQYDEKQVDIALKKLDLHWKPLLNQAQIRLSSSQSQSLLAAVKVASQQVLNMKTERRLTSSKVIAQDISRALLQMDLDDKNMLKEFYNGNKWTKKGKAAFYMLGDLMFNSLKNIKL